MFIIKDHDFDLVSIRGHLRDERIIIESTQLVKNSFTFSDLMQTEFRLDKLQKHSSNEKFRAKMLSSDEKLN